MSLDVLGSPHTYWGRFLGVPETSPSPPPPRRTRYVRRHQLGVPVQPSLEASTLCFQLLGKLWLIFYLNHIVSSAVDVVHGLASSIFSLVTKWRWFS
ncbi:hypothetical protein YC2023_053280 [Brassica napus]